MEKNPAAGLILCNHCTNECKKIRFDLAAQMRNHQSLTAKFPLPI